MKKFIRDCFTGVDNSTWDFMRVGIAAGASLMALGMAVMIGSAIVTAITGHLDYQGFATGMATIAAGFVAIIAGGGLGLFAKRSTEPQAAVTSQTDARGNTTTQTVATGLPVTGDEK